MGFRGCGERGSEDICDYAQGSNSLGYDQECYRGNKRNTNNIQ